MTADTRRNRPLITTGRLSTRMSAAEQTELRQKLEKWQLDEAFLSQNKPLEIELGMGNGMALYARAKANPDMLFVGSEIYLNGLQTLVNALEKDPLPNVRVYPQDGRGLFTSGLLSPARVARILVLFPDPWPKASHHKRRLVQPTLVENMLLFLAPQGELWVVTDWPSYAFHSIAVLHAIRGLKLAQTLGLAADCKPSARLRGDAGEDAMDALGPHLLMQAPDWWQPTKYQEKARLAGRSPWFIKAVKTANKG